MATVHFIQQGKGGVGKSMIAAFLVQFLRHKGLEVVAFDTDPVNSTLAGYKEFDVVHLNILKGDNIDQRSFDEIIERVMPLPAEAHVVIDNGASSFVALSSYIKESAIVQLFQENGHKVFFHSVITGGQAISDTLSGLKVLAVNFETAPIVVWLNTYFGEISMDGKSFEEFKIYKDFSHQFHALIKIPEINATTTGKDLEELFAKRLSFAAGISSSTIKIVPKSRLSKYWNELLGVIEQAGLTD